MLSYWILVCHLVGDYLLQSDWMANEKTKKTTAAAAHALTYTLPFLFLTREPLALWIIATTHFVIDRWRLARFICWLKNFGGPRVSSEWQRGPIPETAEHKGPPHEGLFEIITARWWRPWAECSGTGYHKSKPDWLAVWLLIIADNTMHLICNGLAMEYFR